MQYVDVLVSYMKKMIIFSQIIRCGLIMVKMLKVLVTEVKTLIIFCIYDEDVDVLASERAIYT